MTCNESKEEKERFNAIWKVANAVPPPSGPNSNLKPSGGIAELGPGAGVGVRRSADRRRRGPQDGKP